MRISRIARKPGFINWMAAPLVLVASLTLHPWGAAASTLTFDFPTQGTIASPYQEGGFQFTNDFSIFPTLFTWGPGNIHDPDPSPTSATLGNYYYMTTTTLTRVGGGTFDLHSMDFADTYNETIDPAHGINVANYTGYLTFDLTYRNGATESFQYLIDDLPGWQKLIFDRSNLLSVSWTPDLGLSWSQWDNVSLSATPIPSTLLLFGTAFGGLAVCGALRRRLCGGSLQGQVQQPRRRTGWSQ